jgi:hypothetical protein
MKLRYPVAVLAVAVAAACSDQPTGPSQQQPVPLQGMLAGAMRVQDRNTPQLFQVPGVVGTATSLDPAGRPVIVVLSKSTDVSGIPGALEGVPVTVLITGEFHALSTVAAPPIRPKGKGTRLTSLLRPAPNGASVGNNLECAAGTLGTGVIIAGQRYALSNNHVFARQNDAAIGEVIVQPGRFDSKPKCADETPASQLGTLAAFQPIDFSATGSNTIDAAVAITTTAITCATPTGFYGSPGTTVTAATVGLAIQKVGRTSGLTTGSVAAINATVNVDYGGGRIAKFVSQVVTTPGISRAGDSGSLIVTNDVAANPVALLFAGTNDGTTIGNPIADVLTRFNATICHV